MKVVAVYKTGGDFDCEYVEALYSKLKCYDFVCLTDDDTLSQEIPQIPLNGNYTGWWAKMEMFRLDIIKDDILYLDLDTVLADDIPEMIDVCQGKKNMVMLSDFYRPERLASGVMYIPKSYRKIFYTQFKESADKVIAKFRGDQDFLEAVILAEELKVERWNELLPDYIASYKAHIIKQYPNTMKPLEVDASKSKIICYHGKPRPRDTNWRFK